MSKEAMKLALEALEYIYEGANKQGPHTGISWRCVSNKAEPAITALREALAKPDFWEGYVPEPVKPAQQALDKMAENARELGLDYEPAQQEPVAHPPCKGMNCGITRTDQEHSIECQAEHAAAIAGGQFVKPEQEPVAWICEGSSSDEKHAIDYWPGDVDDLPIGTQLYTSPPAQRHWVGLTNNELQPIADEYRILFGSWVEDFAKAIEAKLKEKNT